MKEFMFFTTYNKLIIIKYKKMKLIKVTKNHSKHYRLKDGRIGSIYNSGYVRVNTKSKYNNSNRFYQINQKVVICDNFERVLVEKECERLKMLQNFENKNC